ncbi:hypothetical protein MXB_1219 [Myxobolus squamalis]|nr:hypothetical protein MXB_1219 [Myxobolus squamalis]
MCVELVKNYTIKILSNKVVKRKSFHVNESEILISLLTVIESNEIVLIGASLECLQKLISYNFFQDTLIIFAGETTLLRKLIETIVHFHSGINIKQSNESIELSIIRVFTSLLSTSGAPILTPELWRIIKFLIHLISTSRFTSNISAARAFLTSFLVNIFQNLESPDTGISPFPVTSTFSSIELENPESDFVDKSGKFLF